MFKFWESRSKKGKAAKASIVPERGTVCSKSTIPDKNAVSLPAKGVPTRVAKVWGKVFHSQQQKLFKNTFVKALCFMKRHWHRLIILHDYSQSRDQISLSFERMKEKCYD